MATYVYKNIISNSTQVYGAVTIPPEGISYTSDQVNLNAFVPGYLERYVDGVSSSSNVVRPDPTPITAQEIADSQALGTGVYYGQVATDCHMPAATNATLKHFNTRKHHIAASNITTLRVAFANFYLDGVNNTEVGVGQASITCAIEYPVGTYTQVTFSGSPTGGAANNSLLYSDEVSVNIPKGAAFYTRNYYYNATGGCVFSSNGKTSLAASQVGEYADWNTTAGVDMTMGGTYTSTSASANYQYAPVAILSVTSVPSFMFMGDSRTGSPSSGVHDIPDNLSSYQGELQRALGKSGAWLNASVSSGQLYNLIVNGLYASRLELSMYVNYIVSSYGINDFTSNRTAIQFAGDVTTFASIFTKPVWWATIGPRSTSTDSWASVVNQTTHATANGPRVTFNNLIRTGQVSGLAGCIELADCLESSRDSGKWNAVTGGTALAAYTDDGLHNNTNGGLAIQNSGRQFFTL